MTKHIILEAIYQSKQTNDYIYIISNGSEFKIVSSKSFATSTFYEKHNFKVVKMFKAGKEFIE